MFFGYDTGYRKGMVHDMLDEGIIDFCITDYTPVRGEKAPKKNEKIITFDAKDAINNDYSKYCDLNALPAVSMELIEAMLPYKDTAIAMGIRRTNFPITHYEEEDRNYSNHLRYWSYIFKKYDINFVVFENLPHTQHKYVIYGLAKLKGIPMLIVNATSIPNCRLYGNDINTIGENIRTYYETIKNMDVKECVLEGGVGEYYDLHTKPPEEMKKKINPGKDKHTMEMKKEQREFYHAPFLGLRGAVRPYWLPIRMFLASIIKYHGLKHYKETDVSRRNYVKNAVWARYFLRHMAVTQEEYNRKAPKPDYSKKYIYYAMHLTPESSTLPNARVFSQQYQAIEILAKAAAKYGIWIYAKEHYTQPTRDKNYYARLQSIKNLRFVPTTESSYDLMEHCVATATLTGTSAVEGALMGKPGLVIGDGHYWKGMPGVIEVHGQQDTQRAIKQFLDGYTIDQDDLKRYFYAMQKNVIPYAYGDDKTKEENERLFAETKKVFYGIIKDYINSHFQKS